MSFIKVLIILILIPIFGYSVSEWALWDINKFMAEEDIPLYQFCSSELSSISREWQELCNEVLPILQMKIASIISAVVAIILLLLFTAVSKFSGKDRDRIAKTFPLLIFITLITLSTLVLVQGGILTYGVYIAEVYAFEMFHPVVIGLVGLSALIGAVTLILSSFKLMKKQTHSVMGIKLSNSEHPKLFSLIDDVATTLGAVAPNNVVVGLEPNFYVTSANVKILGESKVLKGETLYMSLPLARILTIDEIKGIIGHELGHFRGKDTHYSLKFSPIYSGLSHAITSIGNEENDGGSIATLPAYVVLSYILDVFHKNISEINRDREFEADKAASEVAPSSALSSSLLKIGLYSSFWSKLEEKVITRLMEGKVTKNLSQLFLSSVNYDVNKESIPKVIKQISSQTISHPTDSHPPTSSRISKLGVNIDDINDDLLTAPDNSCIELIDNPKAVEEELTTLQLHYYIALGIDIPEESNQNYVATALAAFGAHMVIADGKIEPEEIEETESIGVSLSEDFDHIEFREFCHHPETLPLMDDLLEVYAEMPKDGKEIIFNFLEKIASSDNDISTEEKDLLDKVKLSFKI